MPAGGPPASANEPHDGAARLTTEQVSAINRFPDDNPNPVMRIDADGHLIYANPASMPILRTIGVSVASRPRSAPGSMPSHPSMASSSSLPTVEPSRFGRSRSPT
jgi:hypothetical protein